MAHVIRRRRRAAVAALVGLGLVAYGCGSSSSHAASTTTVAGTSSSATTAAGTGVSIASASTGVTAKSVTIGQLADISGPVPGLFSGAQQGLAGWAAYVNSTGGIGGRKVNIDFKDSALSCDSYTNGIKTLASSVLALVGTFSLVDACGEGTLKANPDLLDLQGAILNPAIFSYPTVYTPVPSPPGDITTVYQWVKDKYGAAAVQKTASLWGSTEEFDYNEQAAAMNSIGYKIVYNRGFSPIETNFTADILRMKADGVEIVDETDDAVSDVSAFLDQAAQQDFHPLAVITGTAYDPNFYKALGNPADADNVVIYLPDAMYLGQDDATVPEIGTMTTWVHKEDPSAAINSFTVNGWAAGMLFQQTLLEAGADPTRASVLAAVKTITNFNANGLLPTENPGQKEPSVCDIIISAKNGGYQRVDPPTSGFECQGTFHPYAASS